MYFQGTYCAKLISDMAALPNQQIIQFQTISHVALVSMTVSTLGIMRDTDDSIWKKDPSNIFFADFLLQNVKMAFDHYHYHIWSCLDRYNRFIIFSVGIFERERN